jgi:2'-5' RNA ligase
VTPPRRAFAALVPPPEIVAALADRLAPVGIPGRRVPARNWHVTLRFVGSVEQAAYERWLWGLEQVEHPPIRVHLMGMGAFPRASKATVLWLGMEAKGLEELATAIEDATTAAGLPAEERPFRAHLTLSRIRPPEDVTTLVEEIPPLEMGWKAERFHVMAAVGSSYQIFESFRLGSRGP